MSIHQVSNEYRSNTKGVQEKSNQVNTTFQLF